MSKEYRTYEEACKNRKKDETTILDLYTKKYRNIKIVRELKSHEFEVNMPG